MDSDMAVEMILTIRAFEADLWALHWQAAFFVRPAGLSVPLHQQVRGQRAGALDWRREDVTDSSICYIGTIPDFRMNHVSLQENPQRTASLKMLPTSNPSITG